MFNVGDPVFIDLNNADELIPGKIPKSVGIVYLVRSGREHKYNIEVSFNGNPPISFAERELLIAYRQLNIWGISK